MAVKVVDYVVQRLRQIGAAKLFGVPAFYCYQIFEAYGSDAVVTSSDLEAGYAADGYAKVKGVAAVSVAYGVGTLSLANAIAGAYAERSAVVVLNGGPSRARIDDLKNSDVLFSHSIGREATDLKVFEQVTEHAVRIDSVGQVPRQVDNALQIAIDRKRPVYIEIAQNLWDNATCPAPVGTLKPTAPVARNETALAQQFLQKINAAAKPALLLGVELQRYDLANEAAQLIGKLPTKCVWASTVLAKSVISESTPRFVGVCDRESEPAYVRLKAADCVVALGCVFSTGYRNLVVDPNTNMPYSKMLTAANGKVRIGSGAKVAADIRLLMAELNRLAFTTDHASRHDGSAEEQPADVHAVATLTHKQLFTEIEALLDMSWIVVADTFLGVHAAADLKVKGRDAFLCNAVWASIGHSVGAAVGAGLAAGRRPLVVCGDGGFQMIAQALSTMARRKLNPVVVLIDNGLYGYEQFLINPRYFTHGEAPAPYVTLNRWQYAMVARGMGLTSVFEVGTPTDLRNALTAAKSFAGPSLIVAAVGARDLPPV